MDADRRETHPCVYHLDADERVSMQDVESIAYQACDKIYKNEDGGPYDSLW